MRLAAVLFFISPLFLSAQKPDSIPHVKIPSHSPKVAGIASAIVPGLGQAYNHKWWKIPVIYAGAGAVVYFLDLNLTEYKSFRSAYIAETDTSTATVNQFPQYNAADLLTLKDYYRRNIDVTVLAGGLIYALNIVDAVVDAHLFHFDVSDDLSMRWMPSILPTHNITFAPAFNLSFRF